MKLITFDKSKNFTYFGECKLEFNGIKKYLDIKMLDTVPEETMTSTFNHVFIPKNNFLCCMDSDSGNSFILTFSTKENCDKILNAIHKAKSRQSQTSEDVAINEEEIFKESFFVPLIKSVQNGIDGFEDLQTVILDLVNSFEYYEKIFYFNLLAKLCLIPSIFSSNNIVKAGSSNVSCTSSSDSSVVVAQPSLSPLPYYSSRKRAYKDISCKESDQESTEDGDSEIQSAQISLPRSLQSKIPFPEPSPQNSPNDVIFDVVEYIRDNGQIDKILLLFTSKERKQCYEFLTSSPKQYRCIRCLVHKKDTVIQISTHEYGSRTFNFNDGQHVCKPNDYLPENYKSSLIIKSSNYKLVENKHGGIIRPFLIIFDSSDRSICHRFTYFRPRQIYYCIKCKSQRNKKYILLCAHIIQHDGKNAIQLNRLQHVCQ